MNGSLGIIAFIATIFVMVVIHEFGHYLFARRFDMKIEEFFIGFGPRLFSRRRGETEYGVKAILLGGYVKIAGMNPWQTIPESELPRTYGAKPAWQRAIVLSAGSTAHLVLATILLWAVFALVGLPANVVGVVQETVDGAPAPANQAGLQPGDRITSIDGERIETWLQLVLAVRNRPGQATAIEFIRDGTTQTVTLTPASVLDQNEEGEEATVGMIGIMPAPVREAPHVAVVSAAREVGRMVPVGVVVIGTVFSPSGLGKVFGAVSGRGDRDTGSPIGLVGGARLAGEAASAGYLDQLLYMLAWFVVVVGVANMLPLPPLDGGHLLVLVIEKVRGRKVDMRKVIPVAVAVLGIFTMMFLALLYLDIVRPIPNPFQ